MAPETALRFDQIQEDTLHDGPAAGPKADGFIGQQVGTIRIHKLLGEGGMGALYAGFDERLRREVALKAVRADSLTSNGRARLLSEARVLSRLNHPNIWRQRRTRAGRRRCCCGGPSGSGRSLWGRAIPNSPSP